MNIASSFDFRHVSTELQLCQRYFQTSYTEGYSPGANVGAADSNSLIQGSWGVNTSTNIAGFQLLLPVSMRTQPTLVTYDYTGASGVCTGLSAGAGATITASAEL